MHLQTPARMYVSKGPLLCYVWSCWHRTDLATELEFEDVPFCEVLKGRVDLIGKGEVMQIVCCRVANLKVMQNKGVSAPSSNVEPIKEAINHLWLVRLASFARLRECQEQR